VAFAGWGESWGRFSVFRWEGARIIMYNLAKAFSGGSGDGLALASQ